MMIRGTSSPVGSLLAAQQNKQVQTKQTARIELRFSGSREYNIQRLYFGGAQRKIMTYNVENFLESKKGQWTKSPKSVAAVAQVILNEDPDVIAFQEVGDKRILDAFNKKHLNGQYPTVVQLPLPNSGRGIQVAIMAKKDLKLVDSKSHWQSQNKEIGGTYPNRDLLEATFETPTGYQFTVFSAHFKSMRGGEQQTMPTRVSEARGAAKVIDAKLKKDPNARIVMTGDLNTHHASQFGRPVIETLTMIKDNDPNNDLAEVMLKDGLNEPTHHGGGPFKPSKLDYMFVSKKMLDDVVNAYVSGTGKFSQDPWATASDHSPIVTIIEENKTAGQSKAGKPKPAPQKMVGQLLNKVA